MVTEKVNFEIHKFVNSDGIFAESLGKLHITDKSWHVVTYIGLDTLENNFKIAKNMYGEFVNMCRNIGINDYLNNERIIILKRKMSEVEQQKLEVFKMLQNKDSARIKRALGPLVYVGNVYKYLFGLMNEEDKKFIDEKISLLDESNEQTLSLLENQTRIIKNKFLMCEENFKHYENVMKEHEVFTNNKTEIWRKIMFYDAIMHRYITDLDSDCNSLINAIVFANEGQIHPKLISHDNVVDLVKSIQLSESNFDIPFSSDNPTLGEISRISKITIYYENSKINYVIDIPLLEKESFTIYKYYCVPNPIRNSSLFTFISPNSRFTALNSDRDKYINLNEWQLNACKKSKKGYICENPPIFTNNENNPCEIKILMHQKADVQNNCDIRVKALYQPLFQKLSKINSWLYSSPTNTILKIICNDNIYEEILSGSGLIFLEPQCKAKTNLAILKPTKIKNLFRTNTPLESFYNISNLVQTHDAFKNINFTDIMKERHHLNYGDENLEKSEHLNDILEKIELIKSEEKIRNLKKNQKSYLSFVIIIGITLIIITIIYLIKKFRRFISIFMTCFMKRTIRETDDLQTELKNVHRPKIRDIDTSTELNHDTTAQNEIIFMPTSSHAEKDTRRETLQKADLPTENVQVKRKEKEIKFIYPKKI